MQQLFRDRLREVSGFTDLALLWVRTLADWAVSVPARYWEAFTPNPHIGLLTDPALRRCIFFARSEASSFSRREITVEHLLLGVLREEPSLVPNAAIADLVRAIEAAEPAARRVPPTEDLPLNIEAKQVIAFAAEAARADGRTQVTPADLAVGILRVPGTLSARLLRAAGHCSGDDWLPPQL